YQRLPFTAQEAAQISAQFPPADVDQLIGLDATRDRLMSLDWSAYRFIHIATHGIVDAQVPQLSALILSSYDSRGRVVGRWVRGGSTWRGQAIGGVERGGGSGALGRLPGVGRRARAGAPRSTGSRAATRGRGVGDTADARHSGACSGREAAGRSHLGPAALAQ